TRSRRGQSRSRPRAPAGSAPIPPPTAAAGASPTGTPGGSCRRTRAGRRRSGTPPRSVCGTDRRRGAGRARRPATAAPPAPAPGRRRDHLQEPQRFPSIGGFTTEAQSTPRKTKTKFDRITESDRMRIQIVSILLSRQNSLFLVFLFSVFSVPLWLTPAFQRPQ